MRTRLTALLTCLALLLAAAPGALADPPPTLVPGVLTVGINMPSPGFQVGAVRGHGVVFARGLEIDLANALAARLGLPRVVFYQEPRFDRLIAPGPKPWDVALSEVTITPERSANVAFSIPYLAADQGVLLRRDLKSPPKTVAALAKLRLCTQANTTASALIASTVEPVKPVKLYGNTTRLLDALQALRCDAVIYDAPILATLRAQVPRRYGPLAGVIKTNESYGVVLPLGSAIAQPVNDALTALIAQGTITTISKRWLSTDLAKLPVLP
jgi:polar amino acid transport system substrate-binding protein